MGKSFVLIFHKEENGQLFEKIIIALKARYKLLSLEQLEELLISKKEIKNNCHISFDDGDRSFYNITFPLLKKHNIPVSLFVSPDIISTNTNFWFQETGDYNEEILKSILSKYLDIPAAKLNEFSSQSIFKCLQVKDIKNVIELYRQQTDCGKKAPQNMNLEQLKELEASGLITIGAHTISHPILKNESDENCFYEIAGSIKALEKLLGHRIRYFAYPNGRPGIDFGEREISYLQQNGITMAFSSELNTLSAGTELFSVPRMGFARMGLVPSNPLIAFRLNAGKRWFDIRSIGKPTEKEIRERIKRVLAG